MKMNFKEYRDELAHEIAHKSRYDISDYWIDEDMKLCICFYDDWVEKDIPVEQRDVDDFVHGNVSCSVDVEFEYDLWDYFFLKKDGQLIKDIDRDIYDAIDDAISKGIERYNDYEPDYDDIGD